MPVSDRLEAVLARTDEVDAVNVAHLAQSISEMRGKSHGLHGIHPGMLATDISPPGSSHNRSPSQQGIRLRCSINIRIRSFLGINNSADKKGKSRFRSADDCNATLPTGWKTVESAAMSPR